MIGTIESQLATPRTSWSIGAFGAIAEFHHTPGSESSEGGCGGLVARSPLGAMRLEPRAGVRLTAYEMLSAYPERWLHGVVLCLPRELALMNQRRVVTEIGADSEAVRAEDRGARLFDLGLARENCDFCVRTSDPRLVPRLRAQR